MDVIEIAKGAPKYMNKSFNVANHWGSSESKQFSAGTMPPSTSFVDVTDPEFHTYALHWSPTSMECSVDGQVYYTFTENIPTDPVDMMMMLTIGISTQRLGSESGRWPLFRAKDFRNDDTRVMSQAFVDYVRVYRKR